MLNIILQMCRVPFILISVASLAIVSIYQLLVINLQTDMINIFLTDYVNIGLIIIPCCLFLGSTLFMQIGHVLISFIASCTLPNIKKQIKTYMFLRLQNMDIVHRNTHTNTFSKITDFIHNLMHLLELIMLLWIPKIIDLVFSIILISINVKWYFTPISFIWIIILILLFLLLNYNHKHDVYTEDLVIQDTYNNLMINKLYRHMYDFQLQEFQNKINVSSKIYSSTLKWIGVSKFIIGTVNLMISITMMIIIYSFAPDIIVYTRIWNVTKNLWDLITLLNTTLNTLKVVVGGLDFLKYNVDNTEHYVKKIKSISFKTPTININNDIIKYENLDDTIHIYKGGLVIINGPSGCGKSLLISALLGLVEHSNIAVNDEDLQNKISLSKQIAYLPQNDYIYNTSIKKNIIGFAPVKESVFNNICDICGINELVARKNINIDDENGCGYQGSNLSGGEKKLISIARFILHVTQSHDNHIIVFDEPFNHLDTVRQDIILELINYLQKNNKFIICITHAPIYELQSTMQISQIVSLSNNEI